MALFQKSGIWSSGKIQYLSIADIIPNPHQPRTIFDEDGLHMLADSIRAMGILQPLSVRRADGHWELVAGERRLRAAKLAGLAEVPCLAVAVDTQSSSLLALMENLQRKDLNFLEESKALARLISTFHLSQDDVAKKIGKSQSAVANKLRILKLPNDVLTVLCEGKCTERHARALLALSTHETLLYQAVKTVLMDKLTVVQTESLVDSLLAPPPLPKHKQKCVFIPKDVRLFLNTLNRSVKLMQSAGVAACCQQEELEDALLLTIRIPR